MTNCSFCGEVITPGTGKIFILTTGKILYFCSNKCEKNMLKLKRKNTESKWTKFYEKGKK
ncbi:MAG: 50S ribosomal protein L24e [archaeon GW2011_AR20]|nr:MAG: 50S ribosomal protein L24e [archaeon GW2011_AR20]MBS3160120.1 50S ribosomal protein L24e [Candidatus Woesearchaeota archaeon]